MDATITGGCLCGAVRYEVTGPFLRASHCHCSRCRRHSGAAVCTQGRVRREQFRLVSGRDLIRAYRPADGAAVKAFCSVCGSSLFGDDWPDGSEVSIRLGSVDGDPGIRPQYHTFVDSRAPWDEITDDLPRFAELPPAGTAGRSDSGAKAAGMDRDSRAEILALLSRITAAWRGGTPDDLAPLFHPDMVIVMPDLRRAAEGREACVASFREFLGQARVTDYAESDHAVDVFGDMAVATYRYDIAYEMGGTSYRDPGRELLALVRRGGRWLAAWRMLLPPVAS